MTTPRLHSRPVAAVLTGVLLLAGCSSGTAMMSNSGSGTPDADAGGMMSGTAGTMNGYVLSGISCTAPAATSAQVTVQLGDMGLTSMMGGTAPVGEHMMLHASQTSVRAGIITLLATNRGWRTHELVVLPLAAAAAVGQRVPDATGKVSEAGSLAEASSACGPGAGEGIPSGSASWVTVTLPVGRYELVCNLANHYTDGMRTELDVT